jgi:hypothetical protein
MNLLGDPNSFINCSLDLHERSLGLLVKLTSFLDGGNASIGSKEDGDWVNGLLRRFSSSLGFFLDSLDQWKHFRVWTRAKVLQDGVYKVG